MFSQNHTQKKDLELGKEPCFNYWEILFLSLYSQSSVQPNEFSPDLNILENLGINDKLF